jgi:phage terminase small subunit
MAARPLRAKQRVFVEEYLVDLCATKAAIRAGYSPKRADAIGNENLRKPVIAALIAERMAARACRVEVTQDEVVLELKKLAFFDARRFFTREGRPLALVDLDDNTAGAVVGLEVFEEFAGSGADREKVGEVKKYKLADKVRALELLGRHLGMFTDQLTITGAPSVVVYLPSNGR